LGTVQMSWTVNLHPSPPLGRSQDPTWGNLRASLGSSPRWLFTLQVSVVGRHVHVGTRLIGWPTMADSAKPQTPHW